MTLRKVRAMPNMRWAPRVAILICLICPLFLASCLSSVLPAVIKTEHEYVLLRSKGSAVLALKDDDPLYGRFADEVLSDPYLHQLLMIFEHSTEAFLATNTLTSLSQTIANKLVIVLDSAEPGLLHNIEAEYEGERVSVELALGLGNAGEVDLHAARQSFAPAMSRLLLELMGLSLDPHADPARAELYQATSPSAALQLGFEAAIEAAHVGRPPESLQALHGETSDNSEALRTPGLVAAFFYRLLQEASRGYPQRYMLWFTNYDGAEIPYAKLFLALNHMPGKSGSAEKFVGSYVETFPAERELVLSLAREVFGQNFFRAAITPSGSK